MDKTIPVLIIASSYPPENVVGALRPARFVELLPKFGYEPHVITASRQNSPVPNVVHVEVESSRLERIAMGMLFPYDDRLLWIPRAIQAAVALNRKSPFRAILSTSPPFSSHLAAASLKRKLQIPWIADFRDPLAGNFIRTRALMRVTDRWMEKRVFGQLDAAIATTDALADFWRTRHADCSGKMHVIYNCATPESAPCAVSIPPRPFRLLTYTGSLYDVEYPRNLFASVQRLIATGDLPENSVHFRFLGEVADSRLFEDAGFQALEAAGSLECIADRRPPEEAKRAMEEADCLLLLDAIRNGGSLQLPAKIFEYIQVGRPILAFTTPGSAVEHVLSVSGVPNVCVYRDDDAPATDRKVRAFFHLPSEPVTACERYRSEFNPLAQTRHLASILDGLLRNRA